ncbi:MAG: monovalent cation/H(+) antiporter subunit G [Longimicrobiales bacterium]|nr:monovalent cation/H(+) antiporter subunit G [Longimicrobiales bacterium]
MGIFFDILGWVFLLGGSFFVLVGALGVVRLPDLFTRLHAAGLADTMGAGLILTGLMCQGGGFPVTVRLILILGFLWFSSPVSTYALARATLASGQEPFWSEDLEIPETARIPGMVYPVDAMEGRE